MINGKTYSLKTTLLGECLWATVFVIWYNLCKGSSHSNAPEVHLEHADTNNLQTSKIRDQFMKLQTNTNRVGDTVAFPQSFGGEASLNVFRSQEKIDNSGFHLKCRSDK